MKVFVLLRVDINYDWTSVIGVYSTKEKAERAKQDCMYEEKDWEEWEQYEYRILVGELE